MSRKVCCRLFYNCTVIRTSSQTSESPHCGMIVLIEKIDCLLTHADGSIIRVPGLKSLSADQQASQQATAQCRGRRYHPSPQHQSSAGQVLDVAGAPDRIPRANQRYSGTVTPGTARAPGLQMMIGCPPRPARPRPHRRDRARGTLPPRRRTRPFCRGTLRQNSRLFCPLLRRSPHFLRMLLRRPEARGHSRSARGTGAGSASGPPAGSGPAGCVRRAVRACFGRRPRRLRGERSRSQRPAGPRPALSPSRTIARRAAPPPPTGSPGPSRDPQSDPSRTLTRRAAAAPPLLRALGGEAPAGLSTGQGPGPRTHASAPQGRGRHAAGDQPRH